MIFITVQNANKEVSNIKNYPVLSNKSTIPSTQEYKNHTLPAINTSLISSIVVKFCSLIA
jgi:hypothetical protein